MVNRKPDKIKDLYKKSCFRAYSFFTLNDSATFFMLQPCYKLCFKPNFAREIPDGRDLNLRISKEDTKHIKGLEQMDNAHVIKSKRDIEDI